MPALLDHVVLATPDLAPTVDWVADALGVRPGAGGQHMGLGTRNFLLGLGPERYLEVIGPDPDQPTPTEPRRFGIDLLDSPQVMAWVARTALPLDEAVDRAARLGHQLGAVHEASRTTPDGRVLRWRATAMRASAVLVIPPLIDWGETTHPSSTAPAGASLVRFKAVHPGPDHVLEILDALGLELEVTAGAEPRLTVQIAGPGGSLEIS
ncbi:MAG TPA: VOC family protein [Candidatus Dormibacteraeota bacterium]|nr:VOC family protein [Candidatus Dormibacteraeota bacterium]